MTFPDMQNAEPGDWANVVQWTDENGTPHVELFAEEGDALEYLPALDFDRTITLKQVLGGSRHERRELMRENAELRERLRQGSYGPGMSKGGA